MRKTDIVVSLIIGEIAALLMLAVSRNIQLPGGVRLYLGYLPFLFPFFTLAAIAIGTLVGRALPFVYQLSKFTLVGGLNFLIDLGVLNLLISATGISQGLYANVYKAVAFLVAVTSSFLWNKFWTFRALSVEHAGRQFVEFFVITAVGFFINVGAFALLNDVVGPQNGIDPQTWASISAGGAAIFGLLWNFLGYKFFVFNKTR